MKNRKNNYYLVFLYFLSFHCIYNSTAQSRVY